LSAALSQGRTEPVRIRAVELVETIGFSCLILRVKLTFDGAPPADIPSELSIKGLFNPESEAYIHQFTTTGVLIAEANFYKLVAPQLGLKLSRCYYVGVDEATLGGMVILDDLKALNARFFTGKDKLTVSQVRQTLSDLARLHAWSSRQSAASYPWVVTKFQGWATGTGKLTAPELTEMLHGSRGVHLPAALLDGNRMLASINALYERGSRCSVNFIHGDDHCGNVHELNGQMGFHDWQTMQRGNWSIDVGYHLGAALSIEDRRQHEQELLKFYLERVAEFGGEKLSWDTAWRLYREGAAYGFFMWGITQRVSDDITDANVHRLGTAVADHGSYELLGV
jgi:hypothetical protein